MNKKSFCRAIVLKVASRCNLNCTYCYVYNLGDTLYQKQPKFLSRETTINIISRVSEHCKKHKIKSFEFVFHGGEPLLIHKDFYIRFVELAKEYLLPFTQPFFFLQTNGVLIDNDWCKVFDELHISVGISLDGTKEANDKNRIDFKNKSSYENTIKGLRKAQSYHNVDKNLGVLSVIDISSDPLETYKHFKYLGLRNFNFLFPVGNHDHPPNGIKINQTERPTPYSDWLIKIFDDWFSDESENKPQIRIFNQLLELLLGIDNGFEILGLRQTEILTIETDGNIEVDSAIRAYHISGLQKYNIASHSIDEVLKTELAQYFSNSHQNLHKKCISCPILKICGGGYILNRYSSKNQYNNPSVYCQDLMYLIVYIHNALISNSDAYAKGHKYEQFEELRDFVYQTN